MKSKFGKIKRGAAMLLAIMILMMAMPAAASADEYKMVTFKANGHGGDAEGNMLVLWVRDGDNISDTLDDMPYESGWGVLWPPFVLEGDYAYYVHDYYTDPSCKDEYYCVFDTTIITEDLILYAKWNDPEPAYSITVNGGAAYLTTDDYINGKPVTKAPKGTDVVVVPDPVAGKHVVSWTDSDGGTHNCNFLHLTVYTTPAADVTLTPRYVDQTEFQPLIDVSGGQAREFHADVCNLILKPLIMQLSPLGLYTIWSAELNVDIWKVGLDINGDGRSDILISYDTDYDTGSITALPNSNIAGEYTFSTPNVTPFSSIKFKFDDAAVVHTVKFDANGGTFTGLAQVPVKDTNTLPYPAADPEKAGYLFTGWYTDPEVWTSQNEYDWNEGVTKDFTLYAGWVKSWKITYDLNGGKARFTVIPFELEDGTVVDVPTQEDIVSWGGSITPPDEESSFFGIAIDGLYIAPGAQITVDRDITVKVLWNSLRNPVTVSTIKLDLAGGNWGGKTGVVELKAVNGESITLPLPSKDGDTFDYWEGSRYEAGDKYPVSGDHTLKAIWKNSSGSGGTDPGQGGKSPATGDNEKPMLWLAVLAASTFAALGMHLKKKRS